MLTLIAATVLTTEISMSCDTTATILRQVTESIKWAGLLSDDGGVLTIHQNETTGAWTLLLSTDNGVTCVAGYGTDGAGR